MPASQTGIQLKGELVITLGYALGEYRLWVSTRNGGGQEDAPQSLPNKGCQ